MKKSAYYSDLIFIFSLVFFSALILLKYFSVPLFFACLLSCFLGLTAAYLLSLHYKKKQKVFELKKSEEEEKNSLIFYLCLSSFPEQKDFFRPLLPLLVESFTSSLSTDSLVESSNTPPSTDSLGEVCNTPLSTDSLGEVCNTSPSTDCLTETFSSSPSTNSNKENRHLPHDNAINSFNNEQFDNVQDIFSYNGYSFFPLFKFRELEQDDIARLYPTLRFSERPILLCDKLSDTAKALLEKLGIKFLIGAEIYKLLKTANAIPENYHIQTVTPLKRSRRHISFAKSNSRRFLIGGLTLLFSALFIPYPLYYLIFGSLLLILSLLVRIFGYR